MEGTLTQEGIKCTQHNSVFNLETGEPTEWLPGGGFNRLQRFVSPPTCLEVYPTRVEDGIIYVNLAQIGSARGSYENWVMDDSK